MDKHAYETSVMMVLEKKASVGESLNTPQFNIGRHTKNTLRGLRDTISRNLHRISGNANPPEVRGIPVVNYQPRRNAIQRNVLQPMANWFDDVSGRSKYIADRSLLVEEALWRDDARRRDEAIKQLRDQAERKRREAWDSLLK